MDAKRREAASKHISLVLRHKPETIGLVLDEAGFADTGELLHKLAAAGTKLTMDELVEIVRTSDKQRFFLSEDQTRIRANQGHSVGVELGYDPKVPPDVLFHGTVDRFLESIRKTGLRRGQRAHVHLSPDRATAVSVGARRGTAVILTVQAGAMHAAGYAFFVSPNGVWLTERVPPEFLEFPGAG